MSVKDGTILGVTVDGKTANINLETRVCKFFLSYILDHLWIKIITVPSNKELLHSGLFFQVFPTGLYLYYYI